MKPRKEVKEKITETINKDLKIGYPPFAVDRPIPEEVSLFCAGIVFVIKEGLVKFVYVPYRLEGKGPLQFKLSGGMYKVFETPLSTAARELNEELGITVKETDIHYVHHNSIKKRKEDEKQHFQFFFAVLTHDGMLRNAEGEGLKKETETVIPILENASWFAQNLFHSHQEAFRKAVTFFIEYFKAEENTDFLFAAVKSGMISWPDNRVKGLLRQRAEKDCIFAMQAIDSNLVDVDDKMKQFLRNCAVQDVSFAFQYANELSIIGV